MCTAETDEGVKVKPQIEHEVTLQGKVLLDVLAKGFT